MFSKSPPLCKRDAFLRLKQTPSFGCGIILLFMSLCLPVQANEEFSTTLNVSAPSLEVVPQRCVALHQGQICYQSASLVWRAPEKGHYCLYISNTPASLQCWKNEKTGSFIHDFQSPNTLTFRLRNMKTQQDLVQTQLNVAWVYGNKKRQRSSWRLF